MCQKIICNKCKSNTCLIKKHCPVEWLNRIEVKKIQVEHQAKEVVFKEGGYVEGIYFIQHGKVKVVSKGADKREQIVRTSIDGQVLGHRGFGDDKYPVSAVAISDTTVCFIDNDTLYGAFMEHPKLTLHMM